MKAIDAQKKILELATEDSYGIWEIIWGLRDLYAASSEAELRSIAEKVIREMLAKGWIRLLLRRGAMGEEIEVRPDELDSALSNSNSWKEPAANSFQLLLGITQKGEQVYLSGKETP